jgi:hypothetical protein
LEQQSVLAVHAAAGPLQKVGEAHEPPLQTPEQQTPPLVVLQAAAVSRQVLPGPPSLPPSMPPSSGVTRLSRAGWGPPQLHAPNVYPMNRATKNTKTGFLILLLRSRNDEIAPDCASGSRQANAPTLGHCSQTRQEFLR